eukprot:jgi/Ulvmu1/9071/UM005_0166.1
MSACARRRAARKLLQGQPNGLDLALRSCSTVPPGSVTSASQAHASRLLDDPSCTSSTKPTNRAHASGAHGVHLPAAIAASALAALSGITIASCDSEGAPGNFEPRKEIQALWEDIQQDIGRIDASLSSPQPTTPPHEPTVDLTPGWTSVTVPVRQGVSLAHLEVALKHLEPVPDKRGPFQFNSSRTSVRDDPAQRSLSIHQGSRQIDLIAPKTGQKQASVTFSKQGTLDHGDLPLLGRLMLLSNDLNLHNRGITSGPRSRFDLSVDLADPFALADTFGLLGDRFNRDMIDEMRALHERMMSSDWEEQMHAHSSADSSGGSSMPLAGHAHARGTAPQARLGAPPSGPQSWLQAAEQLRQMGAIVYLPEEEGEKLAWDDMAGYEEQKRALDDLVLLSVKHSEEFERVAKRTRKDGKHHRTKAVLLEGPPGTGKTTAARVIASQADIPLVYIPLEAIASKWYGESEKQLGGMLNLAEHMGGCIIFLDEVDSLATSRSDDMNEATRRLLGVLLRFIDGFQATDSIVVAATNRKQDLDAALLSRCQAIVAFGLPDVACRANILKHYAAQLKTEELERIAEATPGMSARDLRAICEVAERNWVASIIRGSVPKDSLPPASAYMQSAEARKLSLHGSPNLPNSQSHLLRGIQDIFTT